MIKKYNNKTIQLILLIIIIFQINISFAYSTTIYEGSWNTKRARARGFKNYSVNEINIITYNDGLNFTQEISIQDIQFEQLNNQEYDNTLIKDKITKNIYNNMFIYLSFFLLLNIYIGFVIKEILKIKLFNTYDIFLMVPIYFGLGIISNVIGFLLISFMRIDRNIIIFFYLILSLIYIIRSPHNMLNKNFKFNLDQKNIFLITLLCLSFLFGYNLMLRIKWPPIFDPITHGSYIGLIINHNSFPTTTYPVGNFSLSFFNYPYGFHVLSAVLSLIFNIYPAISMLTISTLLVIIIAPLLYSLSYIITKSHFYSFIIYLFTFYIPANDIIQWKVGQNILIGNFFTGTYPNQLGMLILIIYIIIYCMLNSDFVKNITIISFIFIIIMFFTYTPFIFYIILIYDISIITRIFIKPQNNKLLNNSYIKSSIIISNIMLIIIIVFLKTPIVRVLNLDVERKFYVFNTYFNSRYQLLIVSLILSTISTFILYVKNINKKLTIIYASLLAPMLLSLIKQINYNILWLLQPERVFSIVVILSFIVNIRLLQHIRVSFKFNNKIISSYLHKILNNSNVIKLIATIMIMLFIQPSVNTILDYEYPLYNNLLNINENGDEFEAILWIVKNTNDTDLILNDLSLITSWIPSIRATNIVNEREILRRIYLFNSCKDKSLIDRTHECNALLNAPWNYNLTKRLIQKYDLKYIYITIDDNYYGWVSKGIEYIQNLNPLSYSETISYYSKNPFLTEVFSKGSVHIYKTKSIN